MSPLGAKILVLLQTGELILGKRLMQCTKSLFSVVILELILRSNEERKLEWKDINFQGKSWSDLWRDAQWQVARTGIYNIS